MLSFNRTEEQRIEAVPAAVTPISSRYAFGARLRILLRSLRRADRLHHPRENGARSTARWTSSEELRLELSRSRRFGHGFVLIRIPCRRKADEKWNWRRETATAVSSLLRSVDRVWTEGASVYLLLPECNRTMAEALLARIHEPLSKLLSEEESAAVASAVFPDDGVTSGALYEALHGRAANTVPRKEQIGPVPSPEAPVA